MLLGDGDHVAEDGVELDGAVVDVSSMDNLTVHQRWCLRPT